MGHNRKYALMKIRDNDCRLVGGKIIVKSTGEVVHDQAADLFRDGSVVLVGDDRVNIIQDVDAAPTRQTIYLARKFLDAHDEFELREGRLVAGGESISRYVASHFIETGVLVKRGTKYIPAFRNVVIRGEYLPAVRAFLEMLDRVAD